MNEPRPRAAPATRTEGLVDVAADAIVHGARVVHAAHQGIMRRNFWLLKQVPGVRAPAEVVEAVHDAHLGLVYGTIRGGARALQVVASAVLGRPETSPKKAAPDDAAKHRLSGLPYPATSMATEKKHRIFTTSFASVYPLYVAKAEKKGRVKAEVDAVILWLTGYDEKELQRVLDEKLDFETFFARAPQLNADVGLITGVVCGVRVEEVADPLMQKIRYLDKLIDELAKGRKLESLLRS